MSVLVLLFAVGAIATFNDELGAPTHLASRAENVPVGRQLTAARKSSQLQIRDVSKLLGHEQELHYVDGTYSKSSSCT